MTYFDEASSKNGSSAKVKLFFLAIELISLSYKFVEYEALILGLKFAKKLKIQNVTIFGDSKLVI